MGGDGRKGEKNERNVACKKGRSTLSEMMEDNWGSSGGGWGVVGRRKFTTELILTTVLVLSSNNQE
jgi:hypothetical protein